MIAASISTGSYFYCKREYYNVKYKKGRDINE